MPLDKPHPEYERYQSDWQKARDAKEGQSAIHAANERYLPKLSGQDHKEYKAYRDRALFFGATSRTIDGLSGMLFRKPLNIDPGGIGEDILNDIDLLDNKMQSFAEKLSDEILCVGRAGLLVDFPQVQAEGLSIAAARQMNARPFIKMYEAETVFNWHFTRINNRKTLTHVYLMETVSEQVNEFEFQDIEQIRLLMLREGQYVQIIFRKNDRHEWVVFDEVTPLLNGSPLNFIPFVFVGPMGTQAAVSKPPLIDLVNVNISHYRTTADLEHGAHFTGLPTAVITGFNDEEGQQDFMIGSQTAWTFSNADAKAFFLEFEGGGLSTLQELLKSKENMMAALGAQMLTPDSRRNEAAETAALRHGGEHATLASVSQAIGGALNKALEYVALWLGVEPASVELNRDFMPVKIDPQMMQQLFLALQGGRISYETYFENLKAGEIIASDKSADDELAEIQSGNVAFNLPEGE